MSVWTYSGDPDANDRDAVRFLVGDTVEASAIFQDEEIDWLLTQNSNVYFAAALGADAAASQFSSNAKAGVKTKTVGALSISYSNTERAEEYRTMAASLRRRAAVHSVLIPYAGGTSKSDKELNEQDTDWNQPNFKIGQFDNPNAGSEPGNVSNPLLLPTT